MHWELCTDEEMMKELSRRFRKDGWPNPTAYTDDYAQPIDMAEIAALGRFFTLACKYGNIDGQEAPAEVKGS